MIEALGGRDDVSGTSESLERLGLRIGGEHGYRSAPIRNLDSLAGLNAPQ
jgi:hypothetical protein